MKICLECGQGPVSESWECPVCHSHMKKHEDYVTLTSGLTRANNGFSPDLYPMLAGIEADSFWFRFRNKLIIWAFERYFPNINNFLEIGCGTGFVLSGIDKAFPWLNISASEIESA